MALQVFTSLPVATSVHRLDGLPVGAADRDQDTVTLGWEERVKVRARRRSDLGLEFATTLARGTLLGEGDCFLFDTPSVVIRVIERKEPVFVIVPQTPREWALFAYHVGNSHHPVMLTSDGIVCPDVPGMADMLRYHRIPFSKDLRAFTPVGQIPDHQHHVPR